MTFQEQIDDIISKNIPADKQASVKELLIPIFSAMTNTFQRYDADIQAAKEKVRAVEGIKPEAHAELEKRVKEQETALNDLQVKLKKSETDYNNALTKLNEANAKLDGASKENAVRKAMGLFEIAEESVDDVFTVISSKVVKKDDGTFHIPHVVVSKDAAGKEIKTPTEMSVQEYMTDVWAPSGAAKRVLLAPYSSGGGATGHTEKVRSGAKPFSKMTLTERSELYRNDPEGYKAAKIASENEA